jgi:glycosyltransferase involved in cell wall biosynthesis
MTKPLVSVCLPNLNTFPYLQERVDTIFAQTYDNWELVISDNFSADGAFEFFERLAKKDDRVLLAQAPRQGLYANWNNCIRRARGEYVYIATSDDTTAPDCLEKLVAALEAHPDCDLAHCNLVIVDKSGAVVRDPNFKWPDCTLFARGLPGIEGTRHVRRAPHDGMLHLIGQMVYHSITELLIRRSLFDKVGYFESRWGSVGDLNWEMKASLVGSTVHVPDTWGGFRVHSTQATASVDTITADYARKLREMLGDAVDTCEPFLAKAVAEGIRERLRWSSDMLDYYRELRLRPQALDRRLFQFSQALSGTPAARAEIVGRLAGRLKWQYRAPAEFRSWLESVGVMPIKTF